MFGFGNKKKLVEFENLLSELGNISAKTANKYVEENKGKITSAFNRGLDPFAAVSYISEIEMERLNIAYKLEKPELADLIDDFWLLVALQCVQAMRHAGVSSEQLNFNFQNWNAVLEIPVDMKEPGIKYGDRLQQLVDDLNAANK